MELPSTVIKRLAISRKISMEPYGTIVFKSLHGTLNFHCYCTFYKQYSTFSEVIVVSNYNFLSVKHSWTTGKDAI